MVVSVTLSRGALRMARRKVHRQAPGRHPRPRQHGRPLHRQDRDADRGPHSARAAPRSAGPRQRRACSSWRISTAASSRGSRARSTTRSSRHEEVDAAGWTQARRGAVRLRAPPRLRPGSHDGRGRGCSSSRGRSRTSCGCRRATRTAAGRRGRSTTRAGRSLRARFEALGREGFRVLGIAWKRRPRRAAPCAKSATRASWCSRDSRPSRTLPRRAPRRRCAASRELGVSVKVVTGDNELVDAARLSRARPADRRRPDRRARSRRWTTHALDARVEETSTLFCRVTPGAEEPRSSWRSSAASTSSASWATASTTRPRCTPPTSASRSTARSTSPRRPPT